MEWLQFLSLSETFARKVVKEAFREFSLHHANLERQIDKNFEKTLMKTDVRILATAKEACSRIKDLPPSVFSATLVQCILGLIKRKSLLNYILHIDFTQETKVSDLWCTTSVKSSKIEFRNVTTSDINGVERNIENLCRSSEEFRIRIDSFLEYADLDNYAKKDDGDVILASMMIVSTLKNTVRPSSNSVVLIDNNSNTAEFYVQIGDAAATVEARVTENNMRQDLYSSIEKIEHDANNNFNIIKKLTELEDHIKTRNVVFVGRTGTGKSKTCNIIHHMLLGNAVETYRAGPLKSNVTGSTTSRITKLNLEDGKVHLWDTPGFADQYGRDALFKKKLTHAIDEAEAISAVVIMTKQIGYIDEDEKRLINSYSSLLPANNSGKILLVSIRDKEFKNDYHLVQNKLNARERFAEIGFNIEIGNVFFCNFDHEQGQSGFKQLAEKIIEKLQEEPYEVGALQRFISVLERVKLLHTDNNAKEKVIRTLSEESLSYLQDKIDFYLQDFNCTVDSGMQRKIAWKFYRKSGIDKRVKAEYRLYIPKISDKEGIGKKIDRYFHLRKFLLSGKQNVARKVVEAGFIVIQWPGYVQRKGPIEGFEGIKIVETDFAVDLHAEIPEEIDSLIMLLTRKDARNSNASLIRNRVSEKYETMVIDAEANLKR